MAKRAIVLDSSDESSGDSDRRDSDSDIGSHGNDLVDDEAEEDSDSRDSDDDVGSDGSELVDDEAEEDDRYEGTFFWRNEDIHSTKTFHQFSKLPPELRARVWELFCPDLTSKGRMLKFNFPDRGQGKLLESISLADQTLDLRILSAIHQESRHMVLKKFPDTLPLFHDYGDAQIRFDYSRDICNIFTEGSNYGDPLINPHIYDKIRYLAIEHAVDDSVCALDSSEDIANDFMACLECFPHTKLLFVSIPHDTWCLVNIRWAASNMARHARIRTFEKEPGLGEDLEWIYAWPDTLDHRDFARYNIMRTFRDKLAEQFLEDMDRLGIEVAPMLRFEFEGGAKSYNRLLNDFEQGIPLDQATGLASPESEEIDEPPDEYESEGIDDAEIIEDDESSEDEMIPRPIAAHDSTDGSDDEVVEEARFSSPEPEMDEEDSGAPIARRPKRRIVSDSEDESDGGAPVAKRARRDGPIAISSDEDEDGDDQDEPRQSRARSRPQVISSDEESESSEDDQPPAKMSLAEQLQQSREQIPIPSDDDSSENDGYGAGAGYSDDEDEDDEDDDEDIDRCAGGLIDDMAEDSDEDGEEEEDGDENEDEAW